MTLITQENEHDRLATRLSIILSRLFQGEKLHIGTLAEEFGVTTRTLRRDFNVRLTYLDIEQNNGVYQLASHYFRRRTERDMKILARLLHLDRLLPAMDAKLLSLLLDGERPSPYRIMLPEPRQKPTLFGDFSRLTLAILNQTGTVAKLAMRPYLTRPRCVSEPTKTSAIPFIPTVCFAAMRSGFLPDVRRRACSLFPCPESGWLRYYRIQRLKSITHSFR